MRDIPWLFDKATEWILLSLLPIENKMNKAEYTAQDAPSTRLKITGDGRTDGRTQPLIAMRRRI